MNTKATLAIAAFAAIASSGAFAESGDASQQVAKFESSRTRAEVRAEAVAAVKANRDMEYAGSLVAPRVQSAVNVKTVREEAVRAARLGQTALIEDGAY